MRHYCQLIILVIGTFGNQSVTYSESKADLAIGENLYTQCSGCHSPAYHRTGPKHCGLLGRKAGSETDFVYTPALRASGIIWTKAALDEFLKAPLDMVPGTSMGFSGIQSKRKRMQLIAYLGTLTEKNSLCR